MPAIALTIRSECVACGMPLHVNALRAAIPCAACGASNQIDWRHVWDAINTTGGHNEFLHDRARLHVDHRPAWPACDKCGTEALLEPLLASNQALVACGACSEPLTVRLFPHGDASIETHPNKLTLATHVIGEDPTLLAATTPAANGVAAPAAARPVVLPCPACGASLRVDGTTRLVPCGYCKTDAYLPDDLWRALHPVRTARTWYVWFRHG
jgi:predicted RNA-binding Zn-ribbon protein involved in translation (DUF1610 family)